MKVYMFQEIEDLIDNCEYYTNEELFYRYEDAVKYLKEAYEATIDDIEKNYCEEGEGADDYCKINRYSESHYEIYMESEFFISFNVYEKIVMDFD